MGKLIKKLNFTKNNSVKSAAKTAAISAVSALGGALLDGFHGTVELQNGREIKIKALPADHPYFAVAVEKNRTSRGLLITSAVFLTLIALSVNHRLLKTNYRHFERQVGHNSRYVKSSNYSRQM